MLDLAIVIVAWKVKDKLRANLQQLLASQFSGQLGIWVVDNDSRDGTVEMLQTDFPEVNLIANQVNLGFAKANNQALRQIEARYILLLNPDMLVEPRTLEQMANWMDNNQQATIAGCHLKQVNGETLLHVRRFPTLIDQLAIVLKLPHFFPHILDRYLRTDFDYQVAASVDSVRGGFFWLRADSRGKVSMLDERYFIWFEEVDYCRQVKLDGGQVWYTPVAECLDYVGQSFQQVGRSRKQLYFRQSMIKYFAKWEPVWQVWLLRLAWPIGLVLATLGDKIKKPQART
ncbi:MAG TPA: glycosyltransferase family 2 protein [bacterium]|nr:glycosyltransferase family 2 protein [bacterium]